MVSHRLCCGLLLLTLTLPGVAALGDEPASTVSIGNRIRITYDTTISKHFLLLIPYSETQGRDRSGVLTAATQDSLTLAHPYLEEGAQKFPVQGVKKLYVSLGKERAPWRGLWQGFKYGALFGLLFGAAPDAAYDGRSRYGPLERAAFITATGTVIGGLIGYFFKRDKWREIERDQWLDDLELAIDPARGAVRVSVGF